MWGVYKAIPLNRNLWASRAIKLSLCRSLLAERCLAVHLLLWYNDEMIVLESLIVRFQLKADKELCLTELWAACQNDSFDCNAISRAGFLVFLKGNNKYMYLIKSNIIIFFLDTIENGLAFLFLRTKIWVTTSLKEKKCGSLDYPS